MITKGEIHYFYDNADLTEPIYVYPYKGVNTGLVEGVKDKNDKVISIKIIDCNIKLQILPLILAYADEPQSMCCIPDYDENGDRDLISVATTYKSDENIVLFEVFKNLATLNNEFKLFYEKLNLNKEQIDFFYFEFPKK